MGEGFKIQHQLPIFDTNVYLYKEGDEGTALTGGWVKTETSWSLNTGTVTKNDTNMEFYAPQTKAITYGTFNAVNLTNYTKINLICGITSSSASKSSAYIFIRSDKSSYSGQIAVVEFTINATSFTDKLITLDISSINQSVYPMVRLYNYSTTTTMYVKKVWLEV